MTDPKDRHLDERALTDVLRQAAQLQVDAGGALATREGVSVAEVYQIAEEAGIERRFVDAALARPASAEASAVGGARRRSLTIQIPGRLDDEGLADLISIVRRAAAHQGKLSETRVGVAWHNHGEPAALAVNVSPRAGETVVEIDLDRSGVLVLTAFATFLPWIMLSLAIGASAGSLLAGLGAAVVGLAGWLGSAALIWRRNSRVWQGRLARMLADVDVFVRGRPALGPAADDADDADEPDAPD